MMGEFDKFELRRRRFPDQCG